uniref:Glutaredoxin domain-containing protein n=1 Tax=Chromera velia CCMP2878 TaxID=1169474 RepID=A0A0G4GQD7_9ALVE|mmetsp:Transcript_49547/g.97567  ORF Transcript_49547/g.97567 Transcript_49547/m.97567 type:complete len:208 (+) Transcript_49547:143-766(+)|eukprot:Cvel_22872.t1-p1 / transcript=Cvel_22872.t1 / gene=Cvel_22872 / organism=Chromera_velia_CCMP2878 / gene_product=Glutaredoxin-related protein 5, mitochondrial, putative / transcript_product=Glutaredoxin-related protein 5, mitochondrial, putative / location=Cvel_scaffold2296:18196-19892(-) / protein_length=207 / sequence_SO=supercontig / SO=protein_coding / is_pseudo=false
MLRHVRALARFHAPASGFQHTRLPTQVPSFPGGSSGRTFASLGVFNFFFGQREASKPSAVSSPAAKLREFSTAGGKGEEQDSDPDFQRKSNQPEGAQQTVKDVIDKVVKENVMVLFMKGSPEAPECGFSKKVCGCLEECGLSNYVFVNVLKHPQIREGIKEYSQWPTIPQLYVGGEFIGGCDIVMEMHGKGELKKLLEEHKVLEGAS